MCAGHTCRSQGTNWRGSCLPPACPSCSPPHLMAQHARQIPFKLRWDVCLQTNKAGRQGTRARNCWAGRVSETERERVGKGGSGTKICPFSFIYCQSKIAAIVLNANCLLQLLQLPATCACAAVSCVSNAGKAEGAGGR